MLAQTRYMAEARERRKQAMVWYQKRRARERRDGKESHSEKRTGADGGLLRDEEPVC